jgi:hypothetical protein
MSCESGASAGGAIAGGGSDDGGSDDGVQWSLSPFLSRSMSPIIIDDLRLHSKNLMGFSKPVFNPFERKTVTFTQWDNFHQVNAAGAQQLVLYVGQLNRDPVMFKGLFTRSSLAYKLYPVLGPKVNSVERMLGSLITPTPKQFGVPEFYDEVCDLLRQQIYVPHKSHTNGDNGKEIDSAVNKVYSNYGFEIAYEFILKLLGQGGPDDFPIESISGYIPMFLVFEEAKQTQKSWVDYNESFQIMFSREHMKNEIIDMYFTSHLDTFKKKSSLYTWEFSETDPYGKFKYYGHYNPYARKNEAVYSSGEERTTIFEPRVNFSRPKEDAPLHFFYRVMIDKMLEEEARRSRAGSLRQESERSTCAQPEFDTNFTDFGEGGFGCGSGGDGLGNGGDGLGNGGDGLGNGGDGLGNGGLGNGGDGLGNGGDGLGNGGCGGGLGGGSGGGCGGGRGGGGGRGPPDADPMPLKALIKKIETFFGKAIPHTLTRPDRENMEAITDALDTLDTGFHAKLNAYKTEFDTLKLSVEPLLSVEKATNLTDDRISKTPKVQLEKLADIPAGFDAVKEAVDAWVKTVVADRVNLIKLMADSYVNFKVSFVTAEATPTASQAPCEHTAKRQRVLDAIKAVDIVGKINDLYKDAYTLVEEYNFHHANLLKMLD